MATPRVGRQTGTIEAARRQPATQLAPVVRMAAAIRLADHVIPLALADQVVLLDMAAGRRVRLDDLGRRIWTQLDGAATLDEVLTRLATDGLGPPPDVVEVLRVLRNLRTRGLLTAD